MSVGGVGGGPRGPRDLDEVAGTPNEEDDRAALKRDHTGFSGFWKHGSYVQVSRKTVDDLPAFTVKAKDGSHLDVDVDAPYSDNETGLWGGRFRPATRFTVHPGGGEPATAVALYAIPGKPAEVGADADDGASAPLSLRHTLLARNLVDQMTPYLKAGAAAGAPVKAGAEAREIAEATRQLAAIDGDVKALESVLARSPEAKLAAQVFLDLVNRKYKTDAEYEKAAVDLYAASRSVEGRTALSPKERAEAKEEIERVLLLAEHWSAQPNRFGRMPKGFPGEMYRDPNREQS